MAVPKGIQQTRTYSGRRVVIYAINTGGTHPIHGAYESIEGDWIHCGWMANGHLHDNGRSALDIVITEPVEKESA